MFSGQGPPWSSTRGWLLWRSFFGIGCYDDKATIIYHHHQK